MNRLARDRLAIEQYLSTARGKLAAYDVDQCRLAGPVRADDAHDLGWRDREAEVVEDLQPPKPLRDILDAQFTALHHSPPSGLHRAPSRSLAHGGRRGSRDIVVLPNRTHQRCEIC